MLTRLLKYEFKDTARIIPFFYLITLIFAGMVLSAKTLNIEWFQVTTSVLLLILGIAVSIITFVIIVIRFYKNLFSNEGYLMFTLPVKPYMLLASKTIVSLFWMILSYGVSIGALYTSMYGLGTMGELSLIFEELSKFGLDKAIYLIIPVGLLGTLYLLSQIFFAITISNRSKFHNLGVAGAFLIYIVTNIVLQIVEAIFTIFVPLSVEINFVDKISTSISSKNMFGYLLETIKGVEPTSVIIGIGGYIFEIVTICVLFYITTVNMKDKLSLK